MKTLPNEIFFAEVEQLLSEDNSVMITVQGNSMRPFIHSGRTKVLLAKCNPESLQKGDIVLFRYHGRHVLHRIAKRNGTEFLMAGDGNYRIFENCKSEDIVAKVITIVSRSGRETDCESKLWRIASWCWTSLHPFIRRCILALLWRIGIK